MKNLFKFLFCASMLLFGLMYVSCDDDDSNNDGTSRMTVRLTDAPGDYEEVNVEIIDVKIKRTDDTGDEGWVSLDNIHPGVYNLLELTGGLSEILADDGNLPSGYVGQIRLILGDENTVKIDGVVYDLDTPSAEQSGLKLQVNQTLMPDVAYDFLLDFDVDQSIVTTGSGKYILKPVIRVITEIAPGSIKGTVNTGEVHYQVLASVVVNGETVSAYTDEAGVFVLHGIPDGTYTVTLTPDATSTWEPKTVENVAVTEGHTTDIGTVNFP